MKKIICTLLVVTLVLTLSVTAFAYQSPGGTEYNKVVVNHTGTGENVTTTVVVEEGGNIVVTAEESTESREFRGFRVFSLTPEEQLRNALRNKDYKIIEVRLADGTIAVEGRDYEVVDGFIKTFRSRLLSVTFYPMTSDLYVSEDYEGVPIVFNTEEHGKVSPQTGSEAALPVVPALLTVLAVLSLAGVIVSRKATAR